MSLYELFETDAEKEENGVEVPIGRNADGTIPTFVIGAMYKTNKKYLAALEKVVAKYKTELATDTLSKEVAEEVNMKVFVDTVLFGWKNVNDRDGKPITFSKAAAVKLFTELPRLYDRLSDDAGKMATFRTATLEANAGN